MGEPFPSCGISSELRFVLLFDCNGISGDFLRIPRLKKTPGQNIWRGRQRALEEALLCKWMSGE